MRERGHLLLRSREGVSLVEILIGVLILSIAILGLAGAGAVAARHVYYGRNDMQLWLAVSEKVEDLMSTGYAGVASGSEVAHGYPMTWTVTGTNPKKVVFVVERQNIAGATVQDTLVLYLADPSKL